MPNAQEQAFMILAHQRGLLTPEALRMTRDRPAGEALPNALVRTGHLTAEAHQDIGRDLHGREFVCEPCRRRIRFPDLAPLASLACLRCGAPLAMSAPSGLAQSFGTGAFEAQDLLSENAKTIGPYTVHEELGRGCMGVVYRVTKPGLARNFALKVMLGESDPEDIQRFRLEAQVASKLNDPGIVGVFDIGTDRGRHYYVMDYCPGATLQDHLASEDLSFEAIANLLEQVARTIHGAHTLNVVHRDLKPANILLEEGSKRPRITDFGLAKDPTLARNLTQSGDILGTPYYMSPEQFRGKGIDHRTDVWALGVILYEALTGERPFEGRDHLEVAKKVGKARPRAPRSVAPEVPPELEAICLCALAKDPANRYMSAEAFAEDLAAFQRGDAPSHASGVVTPTGERKHTTAIAAAIALGAAVAVAVVVSRQTPAHAPTRDATPPPPATDAAGERALAQAQDLAKTAGDVGEAVAAFTRAVELAASAEQAAEATLAKASFLLRRGHPEDATTCVRTLKGSESAIGLEAIRVEAQAQEALAQTDGARRAYAALERADPDGVRGLTARAALTRLNLGSPAAKDRANLAVAKDADYVPALFEAILANANGDEGERAQAVSLLERAQTLSPPSPRLLFCKAVLDANAAPARARATLTDAIELSSNRPEAALFRARGVLAAKSGLLEEAEADLNHAVEIAASAESLAQRGLLFRIRSQQEWENPTWEKKALEDWRRAQELDPNGFERFLASQSESTRKAIASQLSPDPKARPWSFPLSSTLRKQLAARVRKAQLPGRKPLLRALLKAAAGASWDEVESLCDTAADAARDCPVVALERARVFVGREAYERGFKEIERARALESNDPRMEVKLDWLEAELYWLAGQAYEAAPRFEKLVTRDPRGSEGMLARAQFLMAHERDEQAEIAVNRSIDYDPDHAPSLVIKAALLLNRMPPAIKDAEELLARAVELDGAITCRAVRSRLECGYLRMFFKRDGGARTMLSPKLVEPIMTAYERVFAISAGTGLLLDAAQYMLMIRGEHPWRPRIEGWLRESIMRRPQLGMNYVLLARLNLQRRAPKDEVLAILRKAREAEKRIVYSPTLLQEYRETYGGPCAELAEFEEVK